MKTKIIIMIPLTTWCLAIAIMDRTKHAKFLPKLLISVLVCVPTRNWHRGLSLPWYTLVRHRLETVSDRLETYGEKGRKLSWERARKEWTDAYQEKYEKFLIDTLYFPDANSEKEPSAPGKSSP